MFVKYAKKALILFIALVLAAALSIGCDSGTKKKTAAANYTGKPILKYQNTDVSTQQVILKMNYYLSQHNMKLDAIVEDKDIWQRFKTDIIFELSTQQIALKKATELGLDKLSAEEQKKVDEIYQFAYDSADAVVRSLLDSKELTEKDYKNEYDKLLRQYFFDRGYDLDSYRDSIRNELIIEKTKNHFTTDVIVTKEDVQKEYDTSLATQRENLKNQPSLIEQQLLFGTEILYYPEGYMYAKHILVSFDSETRGAAAIAFEKDDMAAYDELVKEGYEQIEPDVLQIMQKLDEGADFDALMLEYSDDVLFQEEPYKSEGMFIGPYSTFGHPEYLEALNTLEEAGDYSQPVLTYMGCYIIKCETLLAGAVPFREVEENMTRTLLDQRKAFQWSSLAQTWIEEAKDNGSLKLYPEDRIEDHLKQIQQS